MILTLDPGNTSGLATWDRNRLVRVEQAPGALIGLSSHPAIQITHVVHERPQIYTRGKSKGDPNKLLDLHGQACHLAGFHRAIRVEYTPAEWKGQVPKDVHHVRILEALLPEERALLEDLIVIQGRHRKAKADPLDFVRDALDAIGIGLFYLGRTGRGCTRK